MATTEVCGFLAACELCEAAGRPLFSVPDGARPTDHAPRAVCRFCFIRIVGIVPRQRLRVDVPPPGGPKSATGEVGERPSA